MKLRILCIGLSVMIAANAANAQVRSGASYNNDVADPNNGLTVSDVNWSPKLSMGVGVGFSNIWGNLPSSNPAPAARLGLGCRLTDKLIVGVEGYTGQLSSEQNPNAWTATGFKETSSFESIDVNAKVTVGDYLKHKDNRLLQILSGFFIGSGQNTPTALRRG